MRQNFIIFFVLLIEVWWKDCLRVVILWENFVIQKMKKPIMLCVNKIIVWLRTLLCTSNIISLVVELRNLYVCGRDTVLILGLNWSWRPVKEDRLFSSLTFSPSEGTWSSTLFINEHGAQSLKKIFVKLKPDVIIFLSEIETTKFCISSNAQCFISCIFNFS